MSALELARLRALTASPVSNLTGITAGAADVGREPVRVGPDVIFARHPDAPAAAALGVDSSTLSNSALVALGLCVGLAWHERDQHPYPGSDITLDDLMGAARSLHIDASATHHLVGAVRNVLAHARLLDVQGDQIRLGPVVAGWSEADLEALRRNLDALPAPTGARQ